MSITGGITSRHTPLWSRGRAECYETQTRKEMAMASHSRDELEAAFIRYWRTGAVGEDWDAWADLFTEDARYVEHVLGSMHGREAIRAWIKPIMAQYGEVYTAYEWHVVDPASGRICVYMQNRRDHPSG